MNSKTRMSKRLQSLGLLICAAVLAGCAGAPNGAVPEQTVEERAQERWNFIVAREYGEAWNYQTPAFRQSTSREDFAFDMVRRRVRWTDAVVSGAECEGDRCEVAVTVSYTPVGGPSQFRDMVLSRDRTETWIRLEGQWWHVQN